MVQDYLKFLNYMSLYVHTYDGINILLPFISEKFQSRTNQRLNLQELGFHSFPHLLSHLNEVFKTCQRDGQIFLVDPATPTASLLQDSTEYTSNY